MGLTAVALGGLWYVRHFINTELTPQVQRELTKQLQRPVMLGEVQQATLGGLKIGKSAIPATPTASDDYVIEQLEVQLDLWRYFQIGKFGVSLRAEGVTAFIEQAPPPPPDVPPPPLPPPPILVIEPPDLVELQTLTISRGAVTIKGAGDGKLVTISDIQLEAQLALEDITRQSLAVSTIGRFGDKGTVKITGNYFLNNASGDLRFQLDRIAVQPLRSLIVGGAVFPQGGQLNADVQLVLGEQGVVKALKGFAKLEQVSLAVAGLPQPISAITGEVQVDGLTLTIPQLQANVGAIPVQAQGRIGLAQGDLDVQLATTTTIKDIVSSTGIQTNIPLGGKLQFQIVAKGTTAQPQITAELSSMESLSFDRLALASLRAKVSSRLENTTTVVSIAELEGVLQEGGKLTGQGQVSDRGWDIEINLEGLDGERLSKTYETPLPFQVGDISGALTIQGPFAQPEITAQITAPNAEYPADLTVVLTNGQAVIRRARVDFRGGSADITGTYDLAKGSWQGQVKTVRLPLALFASTEQGTLDLTADLQSDRPSFAVQDMTGAINVSLPQGLQGLPEPIAIQGAWTGSSIEGRGRVGNLLHLTGRVGIAFPLQIIDLDVQVQTAGIGVNQLAVLIPQLPKNAQGMLNFTGRLAGKPENLEIKGTLSLKQVNLADIAQVVQLPFLPRQGVISFTGQVQGRLPAPRLIGSWQISELAVQALRIGLVEFRGTIAPLADIPLADGVLRVQNVVVNQISLSEALFGEFSYRADRGLQIQLAGVQGDDRLVVELDPQFAPRNINVRFLAGKLTAQSADQKLAVNLQQLPLSFINDNLEGRISSLLTVDLENNFQTTGELAIDQLRLGRAVLDRISAVVGYENGKLSLRDGTLSFPDQAGDYRWQLTYAPDTDRPFQAELQIADGTIQDITAALQLKDFRDLARGLALPRTTAQTIANLSGISAPTDLYSQIQYLVQLQARQEASELNGLFPPLQEFRGGLAGKITVTSDRNFLPTVIFQLTGKDLEYGKFAFKDFRLSGQYQGETLQIERLRLGDQDSFLEISDTLLVPTLLRGGLSLEALTAILTTEQRARIQLVNFPIDNFRPFPFYQALPFDLTGNLNGQAQIRGNLANLQASGKLSLAGATINRRPLAEVTGEFQFSNFQLNFTAKALVSGQEPLNAKGSLSVFGGLVDVQLDVKNEGLAFLNILDQPVQWLAGKGLAALAIKGTIFSPVIAGKVELNGASLAVLGLEEALQNVNGELSFNRDRLDTNLTAVFREGAFTARGAIPLIDPRLPIDNPLTINADRFSLRIRDLSADQVSGQVILHGTVLNPVLTGTVSLADGRLTLADERPEPPPLNVGFDNLEVRLTNMQVARPPVFNFLAEGTLVVNGTAETILPSGRINFTRGQFNAVSARFRLDRSFDNYAEFVPAQGLNPNLNVRVAGSLPEITRVPIITDPVLGALSPRDIPVSTQGAQRTLRVQATVQGTASNPNIILTSSPPRTQSELVALIGGGVLPPDVDVGTGTALLNLAGGGILNLVQDLLGDVLRVAEFNLNPVNTNPRGAQSTTLGLAAEAAIDFSNSFSAAVRTIINDPNEPTDYAIRYRIDPTTILRGNINSRGDIGVSVEFETRF